MTASFVHDWEQLCAQRETWLTLIGPARFRETFNVIGAAWRFHVRHWGEIQAWVDAWRRNAA